MNVHKLYLVGRATKDAESFESKGGVKFTKFSMAVNEFHGKEKGEKAYFYDVLIFGKSAEKAAESIKKGDAVLADGRPEANAYIAKDETAKGTITLFADSWNVLK